MSAPTKEMMDIQKNIVTYSQEAETLRDNQGSPSDIAEAEKKMTDEIAKLASLMRNQSQVDIKNQEGEVRQLEEEEEERLLGRLQTKTVDMGKVQANEDSSMEWGKYKLEDIVKTYDQSTSHLLNDTLGETLDKTLSFTTHSLENYMKKVYQAEGILEYDYQDPSLTHKIMKYLLGLALFIRDDGNAVYLGFVFIIASIFIYFLNITTE